jgi:serine protease AprX
MSSDRPSNRRHVPQGSSLVDRVDIGRGTSMAAPVVAGAAALVLQLHPDWSPNAVKAALTKTDHPLAGSNGGEIAMDHATNPGPLPAVNQSLTPNTLLDPATGTIDTTRSSWSRSSWSSASGVASAPWARSSWSCSCAITGAAVDPTRSSWSRSSWSSRLEP